MTRKKSLHVLDICIFPLNNCNLQWVEYTNAHPTGKARGLCLRDRVKDACRHLLKAPSCGGSSQVTGGPQATNSSESKFVSPPSLPPFQEPEKEISFGFHSLRVLYQGRRARLLLPIKVDSPQTCKSGNINSGDASGSTKCLSA